MKSLPRPFQLLAAFAALFSFTGALSAATGTVTKSGSTWTAKVDGSTKYTGSNLKDAINSCANNMGGGDIQVKNGGSSSGEARLFGGQYLDGWGQTFDGSGNGGFYKIQSSSNVGAKNIRLNGSTWFGCYQKSCSGQNFWGIKGGAGILMRIDNCSGSTGSGFVGGTPDCTQSGSHGVETYGQAGPRLDGLKADGRSGGCGLLWNWSWNGRLGWIDASWCGNGTGYAGYRQANDNDDCLLSGTGNSWNCGRGFFALTGSKNSWSQRQNAYNCSGIGIWIQDCSNVRIDAGTVSGNGAGCKSVSGSGSYANVSCQ